MLDRYDKAILRILLDHRDSELSTSFIASRVFDGVSPLTAKRHLIKLSKMGYVWFRKIGKIRSYGRIRAVPKIMWRLRYRS